MKVLVVGSNGFIGKNISDGLKNVGYEVSNVDIVGLSGYDYIVIDPVNPNYSEIFSDIEYDVCINCSGAASVPESISNPFNDFTLNTVRIAQMLEAIRINSPKTKFIHFSSAAVYGNPTKFPISESEELNPVSPYGWHKMLAEKICLEYSSLHAINTISLRVFSAYGPGLRKQLFWDVYQKALVGDKVNLFGTGNETRDFIFVEDLTHSVDILIRKGIFDGRAVNIANGYPITVKEAVTKLLAEIKIEKEIVFSGTNRMGDPQYWQADIAYLQELGFSPNYSLEQGLAKTARWLLEQA